MMQRFKDFPVFRLVVSATLLAAVFELGGIWLEVRGLRREQVKNAVYSLRPEILERMRSGPSGELRLRLLSGRSTALVEADSPLPVKIEDSELEPVRIRADEPLPVEIQR